MISKSDLLKGISILDFSSRLPGPMSTMMLQNFGARITKVESVDRDDPFDDPSNSSMIPALKDWYHNLNKGKEVLKVDFKKDIKKINSLVQNADIILIPKSSFFINYFKINNFKPQITIFISAGEGEWKSLHDLNALALTKTFRLHLDQSQTPPYLPIAGINFASQLAQTILACLVNFLKKKEAIETTVYLKDETQKVLDSLYSETFATHKKQLHNGGFPAYQIYKSRDQKFLCLAAIEEKYWLKFVEIFDLKLNAQDRFNTDTKTLQLIQNKFAIMESHEIRDKVKNLDICLTIVD